jgi:hypothetical protein
MPSNSPSGRQLPARPSTAPFSRRPLLLALIVPLLLSACSSFGPRALQQARLDYNETVKSTTEEQLLLNIVRLRYTDTPSSLAISAIATQFERSQSVGLVPFFTAVGGDIGRSSFSATLPQAQVLNADRPTFSLTPLDDQEFTRKLFTPLPLDAVIYLAKTTWPISTVFRLYLENLNWVSNAQTASGPTPAIAPVFNDFRLGIEALQVLQDRGQIVFGLDERSETVGGPLPAASIRAGDIIEAAKNGYEYRPDENGQTWSLIRKNQQPVMRVSPVAIGSAEFRTLVQVFKLEPGLNTYDITQETLSPFPSTYPRHGVNRIDLETRSMLQALYFVSHGVKVPTEHLAQGLARNTIDEAGNPFDWGETTNGLFAVRHQAGGERPATARVAIPYRGYWFYIDETDQATKSTFSLLVELSRLELNVKAGAGPVLTLPVGAR